jgi:hypothetical protein
MCNKHLARTKIRRERPPSNPPETLARNRPMTGMGHWHGPHVGLVAGDRGAERLAASGTEDLIVIERQDPIAAGRCDRGGSAFLDGRRPGRTDDAVCAPKGGEDVCQTLGFVDDDQLVDEPCRFNARIKDVRPIIGDDKGAEHCRFLSTKWEIRRFNALRVMSGFRGPEQGIYLVRGSLPSPNLTPNEATRTEHLASLAEQMLGSAWWSIPTKLVNDWR